MTRRNIFREHRTNELARQAAEAEAATPASAEDGFSRADGVGGIIRPDAATNEAAAMLVKLTADRARLKQVQSTEAKVAVKQEIIGEYRPWLSNLLSNPEQVQHGEVNEVLARLTLWNIDAGAFDDALALAELVLAKDVPSPVGITRTMGCVIVEEIATAALKAAAANTPFAVSILDHIQLLIEPAEEGARGVDMPDEVRAKLFKARAMLMDNALTVRLADGDNPDGTAGAITAMANSIHADISRAIELDTNCGGKSLLQKIERLRKKLDAELAKASPPETAV